MATPRNRKRTPVPIESELKYLLDKRSYDKLIKSFCACCTYQLRLTNCYFDTPHLFLGQNKIGFRVRLAEKTKAFVTLKHSKPRKGSPCKALTVREEYEVPIPYSAAIALIKNKENIARFRRYEPVRELLKRVPLSIVETIRPLGTIETLRTCAPLDDNTVLELDRWEMFGKRYFEMEVETTSATAVNRMMKALFRIHRIPYRPSTKSKLHRFLQEWQKRRSKHR